MLDRVPSRLRWLIWAVYVAAWATALLVPQPVDPGDNAAARESLFVFSKAVHVSAYALLTILTGWLQPRGSVRVLLLVFLSVHALGTEWLQSVMAVGRTGSWRDVALDHVGIALGLGVSWKWWRGRAG